MVKLSSDYTLNCGLPLNKFTVVLTRTLLGAFLWRTCWLRLSWNFYFLRLRAENAAKIVRRVVLQILPTNKFLVVNPSLGLLGDLFQVGFLLNLRHLLPGITMFYVQSGQDILERKYFKISPTWPGELYPNLKVTLMSEPGIVLSLESDSLVIVLLLD